LRLHSHIVNAPSVRRFTQADIFMPDISAAGIDSVLVQDKTCAKQCRASFRKV